MSLPIAPFCTMRSLANIWANASFMIMEGSGSATSHNSRIAAKAQIPLRSATGDFAKLRIKRNFVQKYFFFLYLSPFEIF